MRTKNEQKIENQRIFKVGVVGATASELDAINRIFAVTHFRNRCYSTHKIAITEFKRPHAIDFILMCSNNPRVIEAWDGSQFSRSHPDRPLIFLSRNNLVKLGRFQLNSPVNPSRFIKMLDRFTISILKYFPEFEIGGDEDLSDITLQGIRLMQSELNSSREEGLSRHALVVDDSIAVRRQMELEFACRPDKLDLANNAEEALEAIQHKKYDIIFLDVVMPGMDGYALCKRIKKSSSNMNTPVVLLTSRSSSFDRIKGALAGCAAYLVKPINHNEFESVYEKLTELKLSRDHAHAS